MTGNSASEGSNSSKAQSMGDVFFGKVLIFCAEVERVLARPGFFAMGENG